MFVLLHVYVLLLHVRNTRLCIRYGRCTPCTMLLLRLFS
jgi:hypothetical protein